MENKYTLQVIQFEEKHFETSSGKSPNKYALTEHAYEIENANRAHHGFDQLPYTVALLDKIASLSFDEFTDFLDYQISQLKNPGTWLDRLKLLLELNENIVSEWDKGGDLFLYISRVEWKKAMVQWKLQAIIENLFLKLNQKTYSIDRLRQEMEKLSTYQEQQVFLIERKSEYLQNKPLQIIGPTIPFEEQLDLEIARISELRKMEQLKAENQIYPAAMPGFKLETNMSVPELAYFFKVLMEAGIITVTNKTDLFKFIANNFTTKQTSDISWKSIKNCFDSPPRRAIESWNSQFIRMSRITKNELE